jgi:hypothetical protein
MRIAYFINQYPKVGHSFIRREILALEHQGFSVQRIESGLGIPISENLGVISNGTSYAYESSGILNHD